MEQQSAGGIVTHGELVEQSIGLHTTHRREMALWLAVEVLMTDPVALADDALQDRLIVLQGRLEEKMRAAAAA
jgi:hypothetical protein